MARQRRFEIGEEVALRVRTRRRTKTTSAKFEMRRAVVFGAGRYDGPLPPDALLWADRDINPAGLQVILDARGRGVAVAVEGRGGFWTPAAVDSRRIAGAAVLAATAGAGGTNHGRKLSVGAILTARGFRAAGGPARGIIHARTRSVAAILSLFSDLWMHGVDRLVADADLAIPVDALLAVHDGDDGNRGS